MVIPVFPRTNDVSPFVECGGLQTVAHGYQGHGMGHNSGRVGEIRAGELFGAEFHIGDGPCTEV